MSVPTDQQEISDQQQISDQQEISLQAIARDPQPAPRIAEPDPLVRMLPMPLTADAPLRLVRAAPQLLGLPLQLLRQWLTRLAELRLQSLSELLPALRLLAILAAAGFVVKLTGATLDALNDIPMLGRLLQLVGLISALNFVGRNALKSQKRAELLARIQTLRKDLLG